MFLHQQLIMRKVAVLPFKILPNDHLVATAKNDFQMHYLVNCFSLFFLTVLEGLIPLLLIWKSGEKSINIAILDREDTIIK